MRKVRLTTYCLGTAMACTAAGGVYWAGHGHPLLSVAAFIATSFILAVQMGH